MRMNPDKSKAVSFTKARVKEQTRYFLGKQFQRHIVLNT
jgi:hypothetical protein